MSEHVLDASALLAVMLEERGAEKVRELLSGAIVGAVNLAEVVAKLQERGAPDENIEILRTCHRGKILGTCHQGEILRTCHRAMLLQI